MLTVSHLLLHIELTRRGAAQSVVQAQAAVRRILLEMEILGLQFQTSQTISSGGGGGWHLMSSSGNSDLNSRLRTIGLEL